MEEHKTVLDSENMNLIPLSVYRVSILHPADWSIFINPQKSFTFTDGFLKADRSLEKGSKEKASLSLRWVKLPQRTTIDAYAAELREQFEKKQKKNRKDRYVITSLEPVEGLPHRAWLMQSEITANHSVYRMLGKEERIVSWQVMTYCEETDRIVLASISTTPEDMKQREELYLRILYSLRCHA